MSRVFVKEGNLENKQWSGRLYNPISSVEKKDPKERISGVRN